MCIRDSFEDTLRIECEISRDNGSECFDYEPTAAEAQLMKDMIAEKIREVYHQTAQEFCEEFYGTDAVSYTHLDVYKRQLQGRPAH